MAHTIANQLVIPLGPLKMEVIDLKEVDTGDTVTTRIQNPQFAGCIITEDAWNNAVSVVPTISGRTITLTCAGMSGRNLVVFVFGF